MYVPGGIISIEWYHVNTRLASSLIDAFFIDKVLHQFTVHR